MGPSLLPPAESTRISFALPPDSSPGDRRLTAIGQLTTAVEGVVAVFVESSDDEQIIERVAALDIGKAEIVCCVRLPSGVGQRRVQEVSTHSTMVPSLCELANRLVERGVQRVVMEATSDYWRPPFYLFEAHGLDPWLVNAKDVKHLPGRPKTDRLDAVWLCRLA